MAKLYELKTFESSTGNLTVFEGIIPGVIQRVFYIYEAGRTARAGHRHHRTWHALVCLTGSCRVYNNNGTQEDTFLLTTPRQCLVLQPEDWHIMDLFSDDAILLVMSNELYDKDDYIYESYPNGEGVNQLLMAHSE